ncbi:MAG: hypothetical protein ACYC4N_31375 [Pirellulaceae bacterium]
MNDDEQHLRLLSIFHYILGGVGALFACFPVLHLVIGVTFLIAPEVMEQPHGQGMPPLMATFLGVMFTVIPLIMMVLGWSFAVCLLFAGRFLAKHRHYTYCLVMAGISCVFVPFGTILGIFTIIVLMRPSVKQLFGWAGNGGNPFQ